MRLMSHSNIVFIGGGNMATSLIGGMVSAGVDAARIYATDPLPARGEELTRRFGIVTGTDNAAAASKADVLVLAVKPQVMHQAIASMAQAAAAKQPLVLSIAAGIAEPDLRRWLGYDAAIVRTMPNTPALVSAGITGMYANGAVSDIQRGEADAIMAAVGKTVWVGHEALIDSVTAISGSGPAYFFALMEMLVDSGEKLGLTREVATDLALHTAQGAAKMALASDVGPDVLRQRVTSPGGTTAAALAEFESGGLAALVERATRAAHDRGVSLAKELGQA
jgi:pyrroline-5-carboxylate reductase